MKQARGCVIAAIVLTVLGVEGSAGARTWAIVVTGDGPVRETEALLGKQLKQEGIETKSLSRAYGAIQERLLLGDFSAGPLAGLPAALQADWKKGSAICRERVGGPRTRGRMGVILVCSQELKTVLWQRTLDHHAPERVIEVAFEGRRGVVSSIRLSLFAPGEESLAEVRADVGSAAEVSPVITRLVKKVREPTAPRKSRLVLHDLPLPPGEDPLFMGGSVSYADPLELSAACASKLPAKLVITPEDSPVAMSIRDSWSATVAQAKRTMGEKQWRCRAMAFPVRDEMLTSMSLVFGWLECGEQLWTGRAITIAPASPSARIKLVKSLLGTMLKKTCRP